MPGEPAISTTTSVRAGLHNANTGFGTNRQELLLLILAAAFVTLNALAYSLVDDQTITWSHLGAPAFWAFMFLAFHLALRRLKPHRDPFLLPVAGLLTGWGLLLIDRLAPNFLGRQVLWLAIALSASAAIVLLTRTLMPLFRYRYLLLTAGLVLLGLTLLFGVNPSGGGARLWLPLPIPFMGPVFFQPSELLKLIMVFFFASYFTEREPLYWRSGNGQSVGTGLLGRTTRSLPFLGPLLLVWSFSMILLVWQEDLGAAALFFLVFLALLYLTTGNRSYTLTGLVLLLVAAVVAYFAFGDILSARIISWLNPWPEVSDRAYQIAQALYAQAAGGIGGQGIGQGFPDYIPVVHSDFAFAAIAEEWGLLGSLTVVACYALLAQRGIRIALRLMATPGRGHYYAFLAAGITVMISTQALLIMGGITRLLPLTGITLPLVSYGGSSLLISLIMIGLLLYLSTVASLQPGIPTKLRDKPFGNRLQTLFAVILGCYLIVATALVYWGAIRSTNLQVRDDNPRQVEAELRVQRGRLLDRNGVILAESVGPGDNLERIYSHRAGPAVGYYSLRYGTAGLEGGLDTMLRGTGQSPWRTRWQEWLHIPPEGRDVRLTLDGEWQEVAKEAMGDHTGALVLLELAGEETPQGLLRAMVSLPDYDPGTLDEQFEELTSDENGPLFNRAALGLYQPGLLLQPLILAAASEAGWVDPAANVDVIDRPISIDGQVVQCLGLDDNAAEAGESTHLDALYSQCPAPLADLGETIGSRELETIFETFGLTSAPQLPIETAGNSDSVVSSPTLAAMGQEDLTITPLQVALAYAVLGSSGTLPTGLLVEAVSDSEGQWQSQLESLPQAPVIDQETARQIRQSLPINESIRGISVPVPSGPEGETNVWFVGLAPAYDPQYVIALILENTDDVGGAEIVGRTVLEKVTNPP